VRQLRFRLLWLVSIRSVLLVIGVVLVLAVVVVDVVVV
jgi:hypothetical protein